MGCLRRQLCFGGNHYYSSCLMQEYLYYFCDHPVFHVSVNSRPDRIPYVFFRSSSAKEKGLGIPVWCADFDSELSR
ncbi:hypothetical protein ABZP36_001126 [Zizania latifolia]